MRWTRTFCWRRTHERDLRGCIFTFHVSLSHFFDLELCWRGVFVGLFCFCLVWCLLLTSSRSIQFYLCFALKDRRSCYGAHGMG